MQAIKCELCGSGDLIKQNSMFICQHCGTKYTVEEARKLLGTVKIDKTDVKENNRTLARRAMQNDDYSSAKRYYDTWLAEEPNNWEPYFFCSLSRALENDNPVKEESCASLLNKTIPSTIQLIYQYEEGKEQQQSALITVLESLNSYICASTRFAQQYYTENRKNEMLITGWIHNKTAAYGNLFDTYQRAVSHYFPESVQIISQVNIYYKDYVKNNKRSISWKQRREVGKKNK